MSGKRGEHVKREMVFQKAGSEQGGSRGEVWLGHETFD